jgi:anti-anti-sigma factor
MSDNAEPARAELLLIEANYEGSETTIVLDGEFDMTGTELFWAHISEAVDTHPESVIIDARDLTFIDSSGLLALLRARDAAVEAGVAFRISEPSPALRRLAELGGVVDLLLAE